MKKAAVPSTLVAVVLCTVAVIAEAQQPTKVPRIGFVSGIGGPSNPGPNVVGFRQGLRDFGYIEGKNILVEYRYTEGKGDRNPSLVAELVQLKVDVLVVGGPGGLSAAKQATKTIPIVIVTQADPVGSWYIDSLARPGGNITGLTRLTRELSGKRLELLKEVVPRLTRVAIVFQGQQTGELAAASKLYVKEIEVPARALTVQIISLVVRGPEDYESTVRAATKERASASALLSRLPPGTPSAHRKQFMDLAAKSRLPVGSGQNLDTEAGGLLSYGWDRRDLYRRAAIYVDKILKGSKPADLPVEAPLKFEFTINLKTAKALNLTIPQSVLYRADRVIK